MVCGGGPWIGSCFDIDWIDGEDEDDDENAREGFNDTFESEWDEDDEQE